MSTTADTLPAEPIMIREARSDDSGRAFELLKQVSSTYAPDRESFDVAFAELTGDSTSSFILAAEVSGVLVGYALTTITPLLHSNGKSAQLQELVVDSAHRGAGVGTALLESLEGVCREREVRQLTVVSSGGSANFYERLGYRSTADFLKRTFEQ
jgi:ribosomal protein S18 acetylase RimI-like enzyme